MPAKPFKIYKGDFDDANGKTVKIQLVEYESHVFVIIDDIDFALQGNLDDLNTGTTSNNIIVVTRDNGVKYDLDLSDLTDPKLTRQ